MQPHRQVKLFGRLASLENGKDFMNNVEGEYILHRGRPRR